ncbi:MAG: aconitate hydratase, partial [Actinobacteria bacterium]|nr:aconitate hydratase [Actinomycetota bacterium]
FEYDHRIGAYLRATGRDAIAALADANAEMLRNDPEVNASPEDFYDQVIDINLDELVPHLVGPHTPDLDRPISKVAAAARAEGYPLEISAALVGSCTNSSYEDIGRAAHVARQASAKGLRVKSPLLITPGSEQVRATIERDGLLADLEAIGATVLANACGPCIGQWHRDDIAPGEANSIVSSFNRNFPKRNDGNPGTLSFIGSPETVVAMALTGRLDVDFTREPIVGDGGVEVLLEAPSADELPSLGFDPGESGFIMPAADGSKVSVVITPGSDRLEALVPFSAWDGEDFSGLRVLMKATGKCTTDHISPAGQWLKYRGHLTNISQNLYIGANNAFSLDESGQGIDVRDGSVVALPDLAKKYKDAGIAWIAIGDENFGEGSSREHAAMEPRYMGGRAILVRSFARIHEANLKKQGMLPLTFVHARDYERIRFDDSVDVNGLAELAPDRNLTVTLHHTDGTEESFEVHHTMSEEHIGWFRAGSALNLLAAQRG